MPSNPCFASPQSPTAKSDLDSIYRAAAKGGSNGRYDQALTEFQKLKSLDPGYPGIDLDISATMLHQKDLASARAAVDNQMTVSECISKLPPEQLKSYCERIGKQDQSACSESLNAIWQRAYLQSALIFMDQGEKAKAKEALEQAKKKSGKKSSSMSTSVTKYVNRPSPGGELQQPNLSTYNLDVELRKGGPDAVEDFGRFKQ